MTRQEEIKKQADIYTDYASNYTKSSYDSLRKSIDLGKKAKR